MCAVVQAHLNLANFLSWLDPLIEAIATTDVVPAGVLSRARASRRIVSSYVQRLGTVQAMLTIQVERSRSRSQP